MRRMLHATYLDLWLVPGTSSTIPHDEGIAKSSPSTGYRASTPLFCTSHARVLLPPVRSFCSIMVQATGTTDSRAHDG